MRDLLENLSIETSESLWLALQSALYELRDMNECQALRDLADLEDAAFEAYQTTMIYLNY